MRTGPLVTKRAETNENRPLSYQKGWLNSHSWNACSSTKLIKTITVCLDSISLSRAYKITCRLQRASEFWIWVQWWQSNCCSCTRKIYYWVFRLNRYWIHDWKMLTINMTTDFAIICTLKRRYVPCTEVHTKAL